jgi:hypothetical protein
MSQYCSYPKVVCPIGLRATVCWFVTLIAIAALSYGLNRGLHVGSRVVRADDKGYDGGFVRECSYLFISGVRSISTGPWLFHAEAENQSCPVFLH